MRAPAYGWQLGSWVRWYHLLPRDRAVRTGNMPHGRKDLAAIAKECGVTRAAPQSGLPIFATRFEPRLSWQEVFGSGNLLTQPACGVREWHSLLVQAPFLFAKLKSGIHIGSQPHCGDIESMRKFSSTLFVLLASMALASAEPGTVIRVYSNSFIVRSAITPPDAMHPHGTSRIEHFLVTPATKFL